MTDVQKVKSRLASGGIVIIGTPNWNAFMKQVEQVRAFPPSALAEHPGWNGDCFALQSGQVFAPEGTRAECVFEPNLAKCARSGTMDGWFERVIAPLVGQNLAMFMIMIMFVPPLLKLTDRAGNFGFELVGSGGKGKSMLLKLMASVIGGASDATPSRYWNSCKTTLNALEKKAEAHSDLPLLLDDATSFAGAEASGTRGRMFKQLVFDLSQAETKERLDGSLQRSFRLIYCVTSNLPLANVIAEIAEEERGPTLDRHLSLSTDILEHHTFDRLPDGYIDIRDYANALTAGMACEYGTAMPQFLQALVNHRAKDAAKLENGIKRRTEAFINKVGADRNDGSSARVAEAIGLGVAAGALARHYGVLPADFDCEAAGEAAYRLHLASTERLSAKQRLLAYAADPNVIKMDTIGAKFLTEQQLRGSPGVYRRNRENQLEFLVAADAFRAAFPDHKTLLHDPEIICMRVRDGRHRGRKRELIKGRRNDRFYCFLLPEVIPS
jgi:hypothetical protein